MNLTHNLRLPLYFAILWSACTPPAQGDQTALDNPATACPVCSCWDLSGVKLSTKCAVSGYGNSIDRNSTVPLHVTPDSEGRLKCEIAGLPTTRNTYCTDCNKSSLAVQVKYAAVWEDVDPANISIKEWQCGKNVQVRVISRYQGSEWLVKCLSFDVVSGDCGSCASSGSCEPVGENGSVKFRIPLGTSGFGDVKAELEAHFESIGSNGRSVLRLNAPPSSGVSGSSDAGGLLSVTTASTYASITTITVGNDTQAYKILISCNPTSPTNSIFRKIVVTKESSSKIKLTSTYFTTPGDGTGSGTDRVMDWAQSGSTWTFTDGNEMAKTMKTVTESNGVRTETVETYERPAATDILVSRVVTSFEKWGGKWQPVSNTVDPTVTGHTGANIVTTWTYYGNSTDVASSEALGELYEAHYPDGSYEIHAYEGPIHSIVRPFANGSTVTETHSWTGTTEEITVKENGVNVISKRELIYNYTARTLTTRTYSNSSNYLDEVVEYFDTGTSGLGGKVKQVTHPNGTISVHTYGTVSGERTHTIVTGSTTNNNTTYSRISVKGQVVESKTTSTLSSVNVDTDYWLVGETTNDRDLLGRPLIIRHFPSGSSSAWTDTRTYNCCGVASETDRYGVTTLYAYDALKRRTKSNTLGVTMATVYSGLTVSQYRDAETPGTGGSLGATPVNLISSHTRNLAGNETSSSSPDPSNTTAGALVATTTATSYQPAAGLSSRTVTTVPGAFTQTSDTYLDGRIYKSTGALQPDMIYGYTVNGTGLLTTQAYLIDATTTPPTTSELNSTQTDWAGRTVQTDTGGITHTYAYFGTGTTVPVGSKGQLKSVTDADSVVTLYAYNALGDRTTTATSLTGSDTINYGTDQITVTETKPYTRPNSGPAVLRTTTRIWRDTDSGEDGGIVASTTDRTPDGRDAWTSQAGTGETHASSATVTTIGLNFSDGSVATTLVSDAPADGFANWTDSRALNDSTDPAVQNTTLQLGNSGVSATWISTTSNNAAGAQTNNEQALYRRYLADNQTDPTSTNFGGSSSDGIGIRVRITGLDTWLAAYSHTAYQIRAYCSSDSTNGSFRQITIHQGDATGSSLGTITPTVRGQADYPTGTGGDPAPRGYGDSPASLTAGTITLTIPIGAGGIRGTLAALKITGLGTAATAATAAPDGSWVQTSLSPDQTRTVTTYSGGRPLTVTRYASDNAALSTVIQGFDSLGRPAYTIDSRTGTTITTYISATCDAVQSVTDSGGRTTSYTYDCRGNRTAVTHPDNSVTRTTYLPDGHIEATWGSLTYSVVYSYDYAGRMYTLRTQPAFANDIPVNTGGSLTTWNYFSTTGLLQSKLDNSSNGPAYTYTSAGRLKTRTWARGSHTRYDYLAGSLADVHYFTSAASNTGTNDGNDPLTSDISFTRDRLNRIDTVERGGVLHAHYVYSSVTLRLTSEQLNQDTLAKTLNRNYDATLRPLSVEVSGDYTTAYGFDTAGRLYRIWDHPALDATSKAPTGAATFTYTFEEGSNSLIHSVTGPVHAVSNDWAADRDVLLIKQNAAGNIVRSAYDYNTQNHSVNSIGQRMGVTTTFNLGQGNQSNPGLTAWAYNPSGELVEANDNGTANIDRAYQYDAIGNREKTVNGLQGNLPATPNYVANPLNQYTRANGITLPMGNDPAYDADGNYQRGPLPAAPTTEAALVWDTENRLVRVTKSNGDVIATDYDYLGRRISKTVTPSGGSSITTHFLYDGWNLIAEYTGTTLIKTYTCGLDLSGTLQGAGGVGGLLAVSEHSGTSQNPARTPFYPTFDGNGNVSEYLDGDGVVQAHYEYDPFGNTVVSSGAKAADFRHRFSTKYLDTETGLYYYGKRYYEPLTGRWHSKDPIGEKGGVNLYLFCNNDAIVSFDILGMLCPVTFEVSGTPNGTVYRAAKTYPIFDGLLYEVPIYNLIVKKVLKKGQAETEQQSKTFQVIRFMPYLNPSKQKDKRYKLVKDEVAMIGLADTTTYTIPEYKDYELHSTDLGENGAFVLQGTHYIHDGPNDDTEVFGSAGCLEVFGKEGMEALKKIVAEYSESKKNTVTEQLKELASAGLLKAKLEKAQRPAVKVSPLKIQQQ